MKFLALRTPLFLTIKTNNLISLKKTTKVEEIVPGSLALVRHRDLWQNRGGRLLLRHHRRESPGPLVHPCPVLVVHFQVSGGAKRGVHLVSGVERGEVDLPKNQKMPLCSRRTSVVTCAKSIVYGEREFVILICIIHTATILLLPTPPLWPRFLPNVRKGFFFLLRRRRRSGQYTYVQSRQDEERRRLSTVHH